MDLYSMKRQFRQSIRNQTNVSTTLATHLLSNEFRNSNVVFSPLPFHVVLSLLAAGSKGQTHEEILGFLKANSTDDLNVLYSRLVSSILADGSPNGGPQLNFVNGIWVEKNLSLKPSFKQVVETVYKAACNQVDFKNKAVEAVDEVNLWVENQTNGLITQVLSEDAINNLTWHIFANAVYFKGSWLHKFSRSNTKESDFHLLNGNIVRVPFMTSKSSQYVCKYDDFKVLALRYFPGEDRREFTMYFYLPDAKNGLRSLVEKMGSKSDFFDRHIPSNNVEVTQFLLPKFKISFGFEASNLLKELGLVSLCSDGVGLTEIVESSVGQSPYDSKIYHTAFMEVNEEGAEAAAALLHRRMGAAMVVEKPKPVDFVADHPFLFVIREDITGVVLFMGQVIDPSVG